MWNEAAVKSYAERTNQVAYTYSAVDKMGDHPVEGQLKDALLQLSATSIKSDAIGKIWLVKGMKVMLQQNVLTECGVVNGAQGILEEVVYDVGVAEERIPKVAYVRFPGSKVRIEGLEEDVVPIFPQKETLYVQTKKQKTLSVQRTQLPILPAYAFTDYKSQGQTLDFVVVDLASAGRSLESAYVMISRATSLENVMVLRDFPLERINRLQALGTYRELNRLKALDTRSLEAYQKSKE